MPKGIVPILEDNVTPPPALPIAVLKKTLASIEAKMQSERKAMDYHENELMAIRTRAASYAEQIKALADTIALLEKV
jgi:predicted  nucleic acid-binding Zn-ribbon protein